MADNSYNETDTKRGPSASLLIVGLLALGVSAWAFIGPESWSKTSGVPLGWIVVLAAIVVGVVLVVSPRKRR
ncbi:hypothetical protein NBRGN_103_00480 [Nocardia brasiliensis NBRC 14402]|uniref:hypothetical protein n=1 Tax=Nocardia brasiliensis TaxID=37326 RepID=UPI00031F5CF1|nr:hypothetical protein [Nocardia brasiliensis]ASF09993.1 hypothetical protein CEQ30_24460 [Nocardia brasiliensis]GAJ85979.1 hypothetical protein NBRGN_103_00480 [Nocardia brasiliensis NBRC 14402]SUB54907.1 Uncharacterised protein [Nocardia brasiliensis]